MGRRWLVVSLLALGWLLVSSAARAQLLHAQVSRCVPVAEHDLLTNAFGAHPDARKLRIHFSYTVPQGADEHTAVADTDRVEVCSYRFEDGPSCPWSEHADAAWMIYDKFNNPSGSAPDAVRVELDAQITGREQHAVPAEWQSEAASKERFLFLRVNGQGPIQSISANLLMGRDGFCPVPYPLAPPPDEPTVTVGDLDVTVSRRQSHTLGPGSYGTIVLQRGTAAQPTRLVLSGGVYELEKLLMARRSRLQCAAACEIRIAGKLWTGAGTYVGPELGSADPADVELFVLRHDGCAAGSGGLPKAASFGPSSMVRAHVYAPNGTLWIKHGAEAIGAFAGRRVRVGIGAELRKYD